MIFIVVTYFLGSRYIKFYYYWQDNPQNMVSTVGTLDTTDQNTDEQFIHPYHLSGLLFLPQFHYIILVKLDLTIA